MTNIDNKLNTLEKSINNDELMEQVEEILEGLKECIILALRQN